MGDHRAPQLCITSNPRLALVWTDLTDLSFGDSMEGVADEAARMQGSVDAIEVTRDRPCRELCRGSVGVINFGKNLAQAHMSTAYF